MKRHILIAVLLIALFGCANQRDRYGNNQTPNTDGINVPIQTPGMSYEGANSDGNATQSAPLPAAPVIPAVQGKPSLIKMYVENSGSIIGGTQGTDGGYVHGITEYVQALNDMAQLPAFVWDTIPVNIFFVNGANPIVTTPIGNSFENKLTKQGMKVGNTSLSDLNAMFNLALSQATNGTITILVSDGIYDIGTGKLTALAAKGTGTRTAFLRRLRNSTDDLQTLIVKMSSQFTGRYCYATRTGSIQVNKKRPYYIWVFGESNMIDNYFSDATLKKLKGYRNHARYVKVGNNKLPFEIDFANSVGDFRPDKKDSHVLVRHRAYHGNLELALIVDFDGLHYPDAYLMDSSNYDCDFSFGFLSARPATQSQVNAAGVSNYKRPFLIKLNTNQSNPRGKLTLKLKNTEPSWIAKSNALNENTIDTCTTYGFSTLTKGIREAYEYASDSIPAVFEITFN